jgi:hypothetical protein
MIMRWLLLLLMFSTACVVLAADETPKKPLLYENTFEKAELKKVPDDMMVMEGGWAVIEEGGNKFIELPGAPLETFGVLFGPTESDGISASARVFGSGKGRRFPTFRSGPQRRRRLQAASLARKETDRTLSWRGVAEVRPVPMGIGDMDGPAFAIAQGQRR